MFYRIGILLNAFWMFAAALYAAPFSPPYGNANERAVATNLNALSAQGLLTSSLSSIVSSMSGFTTGQKNSALNQMHPAPYSALVEMQAQIGGQILSLFHRSPQLPCGCSNDWRLWATPLGNWLREGNLGEQFGFVALTKGVATGFDKKIGKNWNLGMGFSWNESNLMWHKHHGFGTVNRYLGAIYSDFTMECFYCGFSAYGGIDQNNLIRRIQFSSTGLSARGTFNSWDLGGQFSTQYLIGFPYFLIYPYANCDFLYFRSAEFSESAANGLNLIVHPHVSSTIRSEAGLGLKVQDVNHSETICISPAIALGWAMECPINRPAYHAHFSGEPLSFQAKGWNHTWQLLTLDFSLEISIYDFTLFAEYLSESSTSTIQDYWGQRCNIRLEYFW